MEEVVEGVDGGEGFHLVARRVLRVRLEDGRGVAVFELLGEAFVRRPEEADIRDLEQDHRETLEAKAERPAVTILHADVLEHVGVDDTTAEDLQPLALVQDLALERRLREREVVLAPLPLTAREQHVDQSVEGLLQVLANHLARLALHPLLARYDSTTLHILREELDALHLVECGEVRAVDLIAAVDIAGAEEGLSEWLIVTVVS